MKKLIVMSVFALGSMLSFASNGQNELELEKLNAITTENPMMRVDYQESFVSPLAYYEIVIWITECEVFPDGSIGEISYGVATFQTPCLDEATLAAVKASYEIPYVIMYPNACSISARSTKLGDCD